MTTVALLKFAVAQSRANETIFGESNSIITFILERSMSRSLGVGRLGSRKAAKLGHMLLY